MVAGLAVSIARGESIVDGLRLGTAAGAATAMVPGTGLGTRATVARLLPRVRVDPFSGAPASQPAEPPRVAQRKAGAGASDD